MRFDVITLFPELFAPHFEHGVTRRAYTPGADGTTLVEVKLWQLRDFARDAYHRVDDRAYGGGPGMVMLAEPLEVALAAVRSDRADALPAPLVHFSPAGRPITQALIEEFAAGPGALLVCGRYEGIDQRFLDRHANLALSLGDFVLSGGEVAALALLDAVARLQPGVLGDAESHRNDSFSGGLLEGPHYTRPEVWQTAEGPLPVPEVLLSGHHDRIARWRRDRALETTARNRPDLIEAARKAGRLGPADELFLARLANL